MLILCLLMFVLVFARDRVYGTDLTYIVRKEGHNLLPICVGEGEDRYEGIGWIYPIPGDGVLPLEDHYYLPTIKNDYDCNFSVNDQCSRVWSMKNWNIDTDTTRRFDFISDERWEDFPTYHISKDSKNLQGKIEIPNVFNLGFSVRASQDIEILVCEGWDPKKYSCYHFNITTKEIYASRHTTISENDIGNSQILESYKAFSNIIVGDEWRNFEIGMDEHNRLKLTDQKLNRSLIEKKDEYPLKPAYLFFRSEGDSLWKIHKNQFFYTKIPNISRLGPSLKLNSDDLCVNVYISFCANCTASFFMIENGTRAIIDQTELRRSGEWSLIRLRKEHISSDYINIFIQTSYKKSVDHKNGFWAIDDIRVCHENEVKISSLKSPRGLKKDNMEVSCQILEKPHLRPEKKIMDIMREFPAMEVESDTKSINVTWNKKMNNGLDYFISYQANDICTDQSGPTRRTKSNGFVVTKSNTLYLKNLIPYTTYNVTFSSVLHLEEKLLTVNTKEWSYITWEESPKRVRVEEVTDTTAKLSWNKADCNDKNGRIIYTLKLTEDKIRNITDLGVETETSRILTGLKPFTNYTLTIWTSRDIVQNKDDWKFVTVLHFMTKPGLPPPPRNLEVYATSKTSIFLRYNLPDDAKGNPIEVHITRCNPLTLKKCKTMQQSVSSCKSYPGKYCLHIKNMIPHQNQVLRVSLKNEGSHTFGNESVVEAFTEEKTPGQPTNVTYQLVDCSPTTELCNLNISWLHPYNQNGSISAYNIVLNGTEEKESINEIMKIINQHYFPRYTYQLRNIPFGKKYNLYIRSVNEQYQGKFSSSIVVKTADLGDKVEQNPILTETLEDTLKFELKPMDTRMSTTITVIVQDFDEKKEIDQKILEQDELVDNLCNEYGDTWISQIVTISEKTKNINVGKEDPSGRSLKPSTEYCITFLVDTVYKNSTHTNVYYEKLTTPGHVETAPTSSSTPHLFIIVIMIIIILILIGFLIVWFIRRNRTLKRARPNNINADENAYETLPFEDTTANNNMYDHLQHK